MEARDLALSLLRREPKNTEPLPIFMHAAEGAVDSRLAGVAQGYLSLNTKDKADRLFAWKAIVTHHPMAIAAETWITMRKDERADPDFLIPWLERLMAEDLGQEVERILGEAPAGRQIALFSATMPAGVTRIAERHMANGARVEIEMCDELVAARTAITEQTR